jgi:lysozyme family protein
MTRNVQAVIDQVLADEGGIKDVGDGKGLTRFGQTPPWLETHGFTPPTTPAEAAANYGIWMARLRLAEVCDYDVTLGHVLTDWAVHAGERVAVRAFQKILGVAADGVLGPVTFEAMRARRPEALARRIIGDRIRFTGRLLRDDPTKRPYAAGWADRLADLVEALP